jgi:hypothetical protein
MFILSSALPDFVEHGGISTSWFQRSSSRQLIRAVRMVIKVSPARRMRNFLNQDLMMRVWKRPSASLWMAWRLRNAVDSRTCTDFLDACQCQLPKKVNQ